MLVKKCKVMSKKQEIVSDVIESPSRHAHFDPILISSVKMVKLLQQHANTTVHWL